MSYPPLIDLRICFWPVVHFIRPCSLFPIDNLSIYAQNFFKFCIHIVIGDEWYGIVNGQNPTIFDGVTALCPFKKWFLACYSFTVYDIWMKLHRYVEQQTLHITTKDRHSYLSSSWDIRPWLIWKMFLTCSSFTIWNIWMKLHRYVEHQRLHIVTKGVVSLSISVLLLFRHYISHKITFGAPSSGGVLCSACGAFIIQCYANKDSRHFHPSVDLFQSMIWSYSTKWDVCWFVPKHDLVLQHKMGWCFYLQPDFLCWILTIYLNMFLQPVTSLLDIGESSWHNWACPVRKSTWQIPLKQRDTMLNC